MRALAAAALVVAVGAVLVLVLSHGSSGSHSDHRAGAKAAAPSSARHHPVPRRVRGPHDSPVPILMYHVISAPKPGAPFPELYTPKPQFAAQMSALAQRGYHGVTLGQVYDYWHRAIALPKKPIVISFDDGYLSDYTHALPVLERLGWPGVLNLEVNNVLTPGDISQSQVRALIRAGWEVDSHTLTHPDLTSVSAAQLRRELVQSRSFLHGHFGVPVDFFCYPAGRYNATVESAVRAAGYRLATTTQPGLASPHADAFALPRIRVSGSDGVTGLLAKLRNPAAAPQTGAGA
jgi:peptidoglycan/xylan/chitin deacetylase (PgdA/CDA1 family)